MKSAAYRDESNVPEDPERSDRSLTPPHDLDAEGAVLSACMLDQQAIDVVAPILREQHFYSEANRRIYEAVIYLYERGTPVDLVTLANRLRETERMAQVGGSSYLAQILNSTPSIGNVETHAKLIIEGSQLRTLAMQCRKFAALVYVHKGPAKELVDSAGQAMFDLALENDQRAFVPIGGEAEIEFRRVASAAERGDRLSGLSTGFYRLDGKLGGLHNGDLTIVAARPGMGKTSFVLDVAQNVAQREILPRHGVAVFSCEMPKEQIAMRMMCSRGRVDLGKYRQGFLSDRDWTNLTSATAELRDLPIYVDDSSSPTVLELRGKLRRLMAEKQNQGVKIVLAVVDYIQLMTGHGTNREQEVSSISRGLKRLAKELRIPVIALSQLNRAVETRGSKDKRPGLADLRESGAIEQDADNIIFIYRDDYYDPDTDKRGVAELNVAKQRNGPTGRTLCRFEAAFTRFDNLAAGEFENDEAD